MYLPPVPSHDLWFFHEYFRVWLSSDAFDRIPLFRSRLSISFAALYFSAYLFLLHFSTSAPICFICTPLFRSRSSYGLHLISLYFPSERFLSNLRVCFEFIPGHFEKNVGESVVMRCILLGIFWKNKVVVCKRNLRRINRCHDQRKNEL